MPMNRKDLTHHSRFAAPSYNLCNGQSISWDSDLARQFERDDSLIVSTPANSRKPDKSGTSLSFTRRDHGRSSETITSWILD